MSSGNKAVPTPKKQVATEESCAPVREVLTRVGDKWSVLIVVLLQDAPLRFNELRRMIDGISQRMLTHTLRGLERDGLVSRKVTPTTPPSVEYALTPLGRTLLVPVCGLVSWARANYPTISEAQKKYDKKAVAGN